MILSGKLDKSARLYLLGYQMPNYENQEELEKIKYVYGIMYIILIHNTLRNLLSKLLVKRKKLKPNKIVNSGINNGM